MSDKTHDGEVSQKGNCTDDTERETVYVAGRQAGGGPERAIHVSENCPILEHRAETVFEKYRSVFPDDKPVCKVCGKSIDQPDTQDVSHYNALVAAAEADSK